MNPEHAELWQRIEEFAFDEPAARLPFSARLAKDNRWTPAYTRRVIAEYRRFAFLAVAAGHPVSPSDAVDQAWHEHLTYTRSYWDEFCGKVLRRPLHHEPTRGGAAEGAKFADWYARTLASYRRLFETEPPADIWPAPEQRSRAEERFARVNLAEHWVLPKLKLASEGRWLATALPAVACAGCGSVAMFASLGPLDWTGPEFLRFFGVFAPVMFACAGLMRWWLRGGPTRMANLETGDPYAVAALAGGTRRAIEVALARLHEHGLLHSDSTQRVLRATGELPAGASMVEQRIFRAASGTNGANHAAIETAAEAALEPTIARLEQEGFLLDEQAARRARTWPMLLALAVPAFGFVKICVGLSRDRPVAFLVILSLLTAVLAVGLFRRKPRRTRAGDMAIKRLSSAYAHLEQRPKQSVAMKAPDFPLGVALFGAALLPLPLMAMWEETQPRRQHGDGSSTGSGCGSSDSSSSGGGGDGGGSSGCGGCGGGGGD